MRHLSGQLQLDHSHQCAACDSLWPHFLPTVCMGSDAPHRMLNLGFRCLRLLHPSTCPLCRKAFQPDRIKKLHVDRPPTANADDDRVQAEEFELIQHVALFFGENTPDEDVNTVLGEAEDWLALQGDNPGSVSLLSLLVTWRSSGFLVDMVPSRRYDRTPRSFDQTTSYPRCVAAHCVLRCVWSLSVGGGFYHAFAQR